MATPHSADLEYVVDLVDEAMQTLRRRQGSAAGQQGVRATLEYLALRAWKRGTGEEDRRRAPREHASWDDSTPVSPLAAQPAVEDSEVTRNTRRPKQ